LVGIAAFDNARSIRKTHQVWNGFLSAFLLELAYELKANGNCYCLPSYSVNEGRAISYNA
jgi:hypothetical protein